ncbi:GATA zinc finger domain-containing protein 16-like [Drosophila santomea]|uniref:GATA zinc finger domain-containing protein 16-like n=1 Tax=Drosophila santomea TaxID=129105 RepID=UPI001CCD5A75|nr:GATA zinc finger domain-containing protein 16-like [Drosophila santomea]
MATTGVLEAIKVIELVEIIPKYDGEGSKLDGFIAAVEQILGLIKGEERSNVGVIALRAVRSKIIGAADRVLDLDETELNWDQIKKTLVSHFKDKRSEQDLIMELTHIKEKKLELEALYTKVMTLKKALVSLLKANEQSMILKGEKIKWYEEMALNAFVSALKGPIGVTIRNMEGLNIAKAYEIACREKNLIALAETNSDQGAQESTKSQGKTTEEVQKQVEKEEPQTIETQRETGFWSQYQWGGNNQPPFPIPFTMPNANGWPGFGFSYPMMGNPFRTDNFNQREAYNYQRPYRNYQNRNQRWNQGQANRDRPWNNYGHNSNNGRERGQSRQTYNSYNSNNSNNSNNSGRSFNSSNTSDRTGNQAQIRGQLHNIQEDEANFSQPASNNPQDI